MPDWLISALSAGVPALLAIGGLWWRVARVEKDVELRATTERVNAIEKVADARHDGIEKKLDKIEDTLELLREDIRAAREPTSPGRTR